MAQLLNPIKLHDHLPLFDSFGIFKERLHPLNHERCSACLFLRSIAKVGGARSKAEASPASRATLVVSAQRSHRGSPQRHPPRTVACSIVENWTARG
jgi:hypothetical protein